MEFAVLGSGSKGNCSLVRFNDALLMIDCGFSIKETEMRMAKLNVKPAQISAILVTHEHSDHIAGVAKFAKKHQKPIYLTHGTRQYFEHKAISLAGLDVVEIDLEAAFVIGDIQISPVPVPHDAKEPCQFIFDTAQTSLGMLSDLGHVSELVAKAYQRCTCLYIEFNHCHDMLANGPYTEMLKRRVGGRWGHLSNHQARDYVESLRGGPLKHVVIGHISEKNNSDAVVTKEIESLDFLESISLSAQRSVQPWISAV